MHLKATYNSLQKHNQPPHAVRHNLQSPTALITPHAHPIHSAPCLPSPCVCGAPQERCSQEPQNSPCLPKPWPEPARGPNIGDEHRLAERPGPGKKKPSWGKEKKIPQLGFFYSNIAWFFQLLLHLWKSIHLKPTYKPLQKHNHQPSTTQQHWQSTTTLITPHAHPIHSAACLPASHHPVSAELLGNAVPRSLKIHPAYKHPN